MICPVCNIPLQRDPRLDSKPLRINGAYLMYWCYRCGQYVQGEPDTRDSGASTGTRSEP